MPLTFWKGFLETYVCEIRKSSLLNLKAKFSLQSLFLLSLVSTCMQAVTDKNTGWKGVRPGTLWTDTSGEMIQAHGGGVLYFNHTYYWYGENKAGPTYQPDDRYPSRVDYIGINCYSSQDLIHWHSHGMVWRPTKAFVPETQVLQFGAFTRPHSCCFPHEVLPDPPRSELRASAHLLSNLKESCSGTQLTRPAIFIRAEWWSAQKLFTTRTLGHL
mmetsp:Transcript_36767/g.87356  ORF Transcript_36767/g.87356 Transcript_36767/m.87356 type:complete len:215 (+) Transcript_36767:105-749(+)